MFSALHDPQLVQQYHSEYLKLINFYMNTKRPSTFVRYYNINIDRSTSDENLQATYDRYNVSNIKFDVYDFTPSYYIAPIVNTASSVPDLRGQMMDAQSSIVVYTIHSPRIDDLVIFYDPIQSEEIFRVSGFRTPVNALHSNPNVRWFELDLEYAPIVTPNTLKVDNHYVYDLTEEKYITFEQYRSFTLKLPKIEEILKKLLSFYDSYYDLYEYDHMIPVEVNEALYLFRKEYASKYKRILEKYPIPYGYLDLVNHQPRYSSISELPFKIGFYDYNIYNQTTETFETYSWSATQSQTEPTEIDTMFSLTLDLLKEAFDWKID